VRLLALYLAVIARSLPRERRAHWQEGWLAEVEAVGRTHGWRSAMRVARGAGHDALALRREARRSTSGSRRMIVLSWLDVKLALRMLVRYPGLTAIGVLGMAVGIAIAAGAFGILYTFVDPALPLPDGDRIVTIHNRDLASNTVERRALHDLEDWSRLGSVQDVGAFRQITRNLIAVGAQPETVRVAEMSASGFRIAGTAPLLGRHLLESDEVAGAPAVLVIGYDVWQNRFGRDAGILGRELTLGDATHTVVGVMPEGFAFPVSHSYWIPFTLDAAQFARRQGPAITTFAKLVPGASLESAQAELTVLGERAATSYPATHQQLRPRILPYTFPFFDIDSPATAWLVHLMQFLITLLLVVVCVNVAVLVYARTATRQGEIALRTAIGASRGRIVTQLFIEALVLSLVAALIGLVLTQTGLKQIHAAMLQGYGGLPFWWKFGLSSGSVLYIAVLTVVAAAIVGVVPALQATGRRVQGRLQSLSAGGGGGMQLGRVWTVMIIGQVAFAVALLPAAVYHAWDSLRTGTANPGFAAEAYLTSQLLMDRADGAARTPEADREFATRYGHRAADLTRRLESESPVERVTFSAYVPGEEATVWIEVEGVRTPTEAEARQASGFAVRAGSGAGHEVRMNRVDTSFFDSFDVPVLAGRAFEPSDASPTAAAVVVNRNFADRLMPGGNVIGRQLRYVGRTNDASPEHVEFGRWYEIVGVVGDFPNPVQAQLVSGKVYHATTAATLYPIQLALRFRTGTPLEFAGRLREVAAQVDPRLQLRDVMSMDAALRRDQALLQVVAGVLVGLTAAVLLLSSAGVYAMMSFTVAQRRKEIGIRVALGADPRQILAGIFSRAFAQLAAGALIGVVTAVLLEQLSEGDMLEGHAAVVLPIVSAFIMLVGLLAALGPARRGLRIHPTEALRE
jgi:putative ABC transport system permease protein